jgi:hypothetical protein
MSQGGVIFALGSQIDIEDCLFSDNVGGVRISSFSRHAN